MAKVLVDLPLYLFIIYDIFLIISETIFLVNFIKTNKKIIGKNSIKESMDNLTDGICFSKLDGTPLLVNRVMQNISYEVFGRMLVNDVACSEDLRKNKIKKEVHILQRNPLVVEALGKIWQIKVILHENVRETLAYNITLEWELYQEIEKKINRLKKSTQV